MRWVCALWLVVAVGACDRAGHGSGDGSDGGNSSGGNGSGSGNGSGGNGSGAQSDICAHWVSCSTAVAPAGAATILAAYGPAGSCWSSTAAVAADCNTACKNGLMQFRAQNPACGCANDGECDGATPACDVGSGTCVACNADAQCHGGTVCNVGTHQCVQCTSDAQCGGAAAACDPSTHRCVACTSDTQCAAPTPACFNQTCVACTSDSQCTDPKHPHCGSAHTCVECAGMFGNFECPSHLCNNDGTCCVSHGCTAGYTCGTDYDGCGNMISCGTCANGNCNMNHCDTIGLACTRSMSICAPGESCLFVESTKSYACAPSKPTGTCFNVSTDCDGYDWNGHPVETYACLGPNDCVQYCGGADECPPGTSCKDLAVSSSQPPSPTNWGYCLP